MRLGTVTTAKAALRQFAVFFSTTDLSNGQESVVTRSGSHFLHDENERNRTNIFNDKSQCSHKIKNLKAHNNKHSTNMKIAQYPTTTIQQGIQLYKESSPPAKGGEWDYNANFDETRKVLGKSFAGTEDVAGEPVVEWLVNHTSPELYSKEDHMQSMVFGLGIPTYSAQKKAGLFVGKRCSDGELASSAVVVEYDRKKEKQLSTKVVESWRFMKALLKLMRKDKKLPKLFGGSGGKDFKKEVSHFEKKMKLTEKSLKKWHSKEGPEEVHWYVQTVGVAPEHNGKGYGRELMEQVGSLADQVGVSCYLECGASKRGFYEKMGFQVLSERTLEDPVDSTREPLQVCTMIRKPSTLEEQ